MMGVTRLHGARLGAGRCDSAACEGETIVGGLVRHTNARGACPGWPWGLSRPALTDPPWGCRGMQFSALGCPGMPWKHQQSPGSTAQLSQWRPRWRRLNHGAAQFNEPQHQSFMFAPFSRLSPIACIRSSAQARAHPTCRSPPPAPPTTPPTPPTLAQRVECVALMLCRRPLERRCGQVGWPCMSCFCLFLGASSVLPLLFPSFPTACYRVLSQGSVSCFFFGG